MKKRWLSLLLVLMIIITIVPKAEGSSPVFFVGVNDSVPMYLPTAEAPYYKGGVLYIPYTVFNAGPGGVAVSYNADKGSLALFTRAKRLVYDINAGMLTDESQRVSKVDVVFRNGVPFIPASRAVSHFGLTTAMLTSATGSSVLRFTDGSQNLDNTTFIRKAETLISIILEQHEVKEETTQPVEEQVPEPTGPVTVYIAVAGDAVTRQTLQTLRDQNVYAAFFLTQKQIRENSELVREIYAAGHQIGLTVEAEQMDYADALGNANKELDRVLFCKSLMALLPGGAGDFPQYAVFREWTAQNNVEEILKTDGVQLLVCRTDIAYTLQTLLQEGAHLPQLIETTQIPGVSTK